MDARWPLRGTTERYASGGWLMGHTWPIVAVTCSPDGQLLATGSDDQTARLWRMSDGGLLRILKPHPDYHAYYIGSLAFTHDGKVLITGSEDHTVRLWRVED